MSETCHPGIAYILQLYTEEQSRVDTALTHSVYKSLSCGLREAGHWQVASEWEKHILLL